MTKCSKWIPVFAGITEAQINLRAKQFNDDTKYALGLRLFCGWWFYGQKMGILRYTLTMEKYKKRIDIRNM
jgi:hypothetical protein